MPMRILFIYHKEQEGKPFHTAEREVEFSLENSNLSLNYSLISG